MRMFPFNRLTASLVIAVSDCPETALLQTGSADTFQRHGVISSRRLVLRGSCTIAAHSNSNKQSSLSSSSSPKLRGRQLIGAHPLGDSVAKIRSESSDHSADLHCPLLHATQTWHTIVFEAILLEIDAKEHRLYRA